MQLRAENISRRYFRKHGEANFFEAVRSVSLTLESGKLTVLNGKSGSGKTTLLNMIGGLLNPSEGKVFLDETDLYALEDKDLSRLRSKRIGVIPQGRSAVDTLSVYENILLPGMLYGGTLRTEEAENWMTVLGISDLRNAMPAELSGGELRRMAIARTLTASPEVILADEPTGDLDNENTRTVLTAFQQAAKAGKAVLVVSHETDAEAYADQILHMSHGTIE
ncbi:MAG: ABC transporter ATP-binding protein [Clostridia bacterium]|nr:ABC transporter ATP-binding protein [Clostridia bacterium]MBR4576171.1 ABC transporter ATP-binding protein [Clostridia bacterium]